MVKALNLFNHKFTLFDSSLDDMYNYDPYCLKILNEMYQSESSALDKTLLKNIETAFHDIELIKLWINHTISDFRKFSRKNKQKSLNSRNSKISAVTFLQYLEYSLNTYGFLAKKKLTVIKKLLTLEELMDVFSKGNPFLDVPGVDASRTIDGVNVRIKHSAFPHLLQLHYLHFSISKYEVISISKIKKLFQLFSSDKKLVERVYVPLFDNIGVHKNFTNPDFISKLGRYFFNLPSNYHEFLFSELANDWFGEKIDRYRNIEISAKKDLVYYIFPKDMNDDFITDEFKSDANIVSALKSEYTVFDIHFFIKTVDENKPLGPCFANFDRFSTPVKAVYRSYIIGTKYYKKLYQYLKINHNIILVNDSKENKFVHLIPNWKDKLGECFSETHCFSFDPSKDSIEHIIQQIKEDSGIKKQQYLLKDYNKSAKENWESACIVNMNDSVHEISKKISSFLYWRGRNFEGGICLRLLVDYPIIFTEKADSPFPPLYEYRVFVFNEKIIFYNRRYPEYDYQCNQKAIASFFKRIKINSKIKSKFYAIDVVKLEAGGFDIIEIDDAQFCGVFESKENFYKKLNSEIKRLNYVG
jgi:hypothetical protein